MSLGVSCNIYFDPLCKLSNTIKLFFIIQNVGTVLCQEDTWFAAMNRFLATRRVLILVDMSESRSLQDW